MNLTRRQALAMGLIALAISLIPRGMATVLVVGDGLPGEWVRPLDCLRDLFTDLGPPRDIGHRYLQSFPQERNRALLERAITGEQQLYDARQLRTLLAHKREHDFSTGDIAVVDGWVLSRTEARACALIALL